MDVTLVQDPEHDINHNHGSQNQERLAGERRTEFRCRTGKGRRNGVWQSDFALRFLNRRDRMTERAAAAQVE